MSAFLILRCGFWGSYRIELDRKTRAIQVRLVDNYAPKDRVAAQAFKRATDPEFRAAHSTRLKARNADPIFQAKCRVGLARCKTDPIWRETEIARRKAIYADPEYKAANSARMKTRHTDPEFGSYENEVYRS